MNTMTLEQVRDWHAKCATMCRRTREPALADKHQKMADAIDAHLAQPAQAVDVDDLAQEIRRLDGNHTMGAGILAEALLPFINRALSGEKAGPVDGWKLVPFEPTPAMRATFRADPEALTHFTHTTLQCADFDSRYRAMLGAASPAPDKEGL